MTKRRRRYGRDRRSGQDRRQRKRRGRPRKELDLTWLDAAIAEGRSHEDLAQQAGIHRATLDRRLTERRGVLLRRCPFPECYAIVRTALATHCPRGHAL